jgi:predicted RNase H-like HicB family nuclease
MSTVSYPVFVYADPDAPDIYVVEAPDLPGLATEGPTIEAALVNAREAIALYLEELHVRGEEPPQPTIVILGSVSVHVA